MQHKTVRLTTLLLIAAFFIAIFRTSATVADDFEGTIKLEGEDTFSLTASEMQLFDFNNIAPGDVRTGTLHIENTTDSKMECRIISIMSYSKDKRLFNAMRLRIMDRKGGELYAGPYGIKGSEPLAVISVKAKSIKTFDLEVTFPTDEGNEYQAAEMDSIWTFEARVFDKSASSDNEDDGNDKNNSGNGNANDSGGDMGTHPDGSKGDNDTKPGASETGSSETNGTGKDTSGVKTGLDLTLSNAKLITGLILVCLCFLVSVVTSIRIYAAKHKRTNRTTK